MKAENPNPNKGLEGKSLEEIQNIVRDNVKAIFPSSWIANSITAMGLVDKNPPLITESSVRASWTGRCFFYDEAKPGQRFGSLVSADLESGKLITIRQSGKNVVLNLNLYPINMEGALSNLMESAMIEQESLFRVLTDIKDLNSEANRGQKAIVSYSLMSNPNNKIGFLDKDFSKLLPPSSK